VTGIVVKPTPLTIISTFPNKKLSMNQSKALGMGPIKESE